MLLCLVVLSSRLCNTEHTLVIGIPFLKHLNPPQWEDRRNTLQLFLFLLAASQARFFFLLSVHRHQLWTINVELPTTPPPCKVLSLGNVVVSGGYVLKQQPPFWLCHRFLFCPFPESIMHQCGITDLQLKRTSIS